MPRIDYLWIILGVIVVVLLLSWGTLRGWYSDVRYKATNQEQYERGKVIFYDEEIWAGEGANKSCAACHAPDYVKPAGVTIEMQEYVEGQPLVLKDIQKKYGSNMLSSDDRLFTQIMVCLANPTRMGCGKVSRNAKHIQDLLEYVRRQ
jgi:hypothetical protein